MNAEVKSFVERHESEIVQHLLDHIQDAVVLDEPALDEPALVSFEPAWVYLAVQDMSDSDNGFFYVCGHNT